MNSMDSESESTQPQLAAGAQSGFASYVAPFVRTVWACIERRGYATIENSFHLAPGIHRRCRRWVCLERRAVKGDFSEIYGHIDRTDFHFRDEACAIHPRQEGDFA